MACPAAVQGCQRTNKYAGGLKPACCTKSNRVWLRAWGSSGSCSASKAAATSAGGALSGMSLHGGRGKQGEGGSRAMASNDILRPAASVWRRRHMAWNLETFLPPSPFPPTDTIVLESGYTRAVSTSCSLRRHCGGGVGMSSLSGRAVGRPSMWSASSAVSRWRVHLMPFLLTLPCPPPTLTSVCSRAGLVTPLSLWSRKMPAAPGGSGSAVHAACSSSWAPTAGRRNMVRRGAALQSAQGEDESRQRRRRQQRRTCSQGRSQHRQRQR